MIYYTQQEPKIASRTWSKQQERLSGLWHDSQYGYNKSKIGDEGYI